MDARAEVGLLNRSIRIEGYLNRGQVRFLQNTPQTTKIHIDWTEFTNLGDVALKNYGGGYPLHFHMMGDVGGHTGSYVKYCSLHHNGRNNLVIHETSNLLVEGNVFYDTIGWHVWFQEDKPDCTGNIVRQNLALVAREDTAVVEDDLPTDQGLGNAACFYLRNLDNVITDNHAGSSWASGFYVNTVEVFSRQPLNYGWSQYHVNPTFSSNLAHSCASHGFYLGGFTEFIPGSPGPPDPPPTNMPTFQYFTAYKNNAFGLHCRNFGTCIWDNAQLADNGSGVYFASRGFWLGEHEGINRLKGGKVIGESSSNLGLVDPQMVDFEIPFGAAPSVVKREQNFESARTQGVAVPSLGSLPALMSYLDTGYYLDTANKLYLRIRLSESTVGAGLSQWGPVFDGAPVYVRNE